MLLLDVSLDSIDDGGGPLDNQRLQTVLLVQVSVHVLLQRLLAHLVLRAFLVKLYFLGIHILDRILELLEGQYAVLSSTDWGVGASVWSG